MLDGLSLDILAGRSLVIVGVSGTGKTVLIKHLIGLIRPDEGQVLVDGKDLWAMSERERSLVRRRFGLAFQEGALFDSMSVFDNVAFALRRHTRMSPEEIAERVRTCLRLVAALGGRGQAPGRAVHRHASPGRASRGRSRSSRRSCSSTSRPPASTSSPSR